MLGPNMKQAATTSERKQRVGSLNTGFDAVTPQIAQRLLF